MSEPREVDSPGDGADARAVGPEVAATTDPHDLQFDRVEPVADDTPAAAVTCVGCQRALTDEYFVVNLKIACDRCRRATLAASETAGGLRTFGRAALYGAAGAAIGSLVYFAVLKLTGYEIGLIAILVGLLVGRAVRFGSGGRGGRRYQALAMVLTYSAIVSTYMPMIYSAIRERGDATAASASSAAPTSTPTATPGEPSPAPPAKADPVERPGLAKALGLTVVFVGVLFLFAAAAPFLAGFKNIMGWIIIGIALYEAWKINKPPLLVVRGPFRVGEPNDAAPPP